MGPNDTITSECKEFYDTITPLYDNAILSNETDWIIRKLENKIVRNLIKENGALSNNLVLDVGAGTGYYSNLAANYFERVIAIDISNDMLMRIHTDGNKIWRVTSDSAYLPFNDCSFDVVLCVYGVLNNLDENTRVHTIKEIHRVLKEGGKLIFSIFRKTREHNFKSWTVNTFDKCYSIFEDKLTDEEIDKLLNCADLNIIKSITVPNISGKLYLKLLNKRIANLNMIPLRASLLYSIEELIANIPKINERGWLYIGVAEKNKNRTI